MKRFVFLLAGIGLIGFAGIEILGDADAYRLFNGPVYTTYKTDRGLLRCGQSTQAHNGDSICASPTYNYRPSTHSRLRNDTPRYHKAKPHTSDGYKYRGSFYSRKRGFTAYELMSSDEKREYLKNQNDRFHNRTPKPSVKTSLFNRYGTPDDSGFNVYASTNSSFNSDVFPAHAIEVRDGVYFAYYHNPNTVKTPSQRRTFRYYTND